MSRATNSPECDNEAGQDGAGGHRPDPVKLQVGEVFSVLASASGVEARRGANCRDYVSRRDEALRIGSALARHQPRAQRCQVTRCRAAAWFNVRLSLPDGTSSCAKVAVRGTDLSAGMFEVSANSAHTPRALSSLTLGTYVFTLPFLCSAYLVPLRARSAPVAAPGWIQRPCQHVRGHEPPALVNLRSRSTVL
jgi:hypothetical protein